MDDMEITYLPISQLKPYEKNPRINDNAVDACASSIKEYGFKVPIIIDSEKTIIAGHTRLKAAKKLGMKTVPCIIADDLSEEQVRAFRIADNKVSDFSIWDNRLLLEELDALSDFDLFTGFDFDDLPSMQVMDEKDNDVIDENEDGVTYEAVFRSMNKCKIDKIKEIWETLEDE